MRGDHEQRGGYTHRNHSCKGIGPGDPVHVDVGAGGYELLVRVEAGKVARECPLYRNG